MKFLVVLAMMLPSLAMAKTTTFKGEGIWQTPEKNFVPYKVTIVVDAKKNKKGELESENITISSTWVDPRTETEESSTFSFEKNYMDGAVYSIDKSDSKIGQGFCLPTGAESKQCRAKYEMVTDGKDGKKMSFDVEAWGYVDADNQVAYRSGTVLDLSSDSAQRLPWTEILRPVAEKKK